MKTKKFSKRLALNKKTIANLNKHEMRFAKGGVKSMFATSCASEDPCNTSWDYCDETICDTVCGGETQLAMCTLLQ